MRPDIMDEVVLGTFIGSGSMGRCYRGMWQVRQESGQAGRGGRQADRHTAGSKACTSKWQANWSGEQPQFCVPGC